MKIFATISMLLAFLFTVTAFAADLQKGQDALEAEDYETALQELTPLAEQGDAQAQYHLGSIYHLSQDGHQDYSKALKWYRLSAEQGNATAQNSLAIMYAQGQGVAPNLITAHMWVVLAIALWERAWLENEDSEAWASGTIAIQLRRLIASNLNEAQIEEAQKLASECQARIFKDC